jgi:hypothetical protein
MRSIIIFGIVLIISISVTIYLSYKNNNDLKSGKFWTCGVTGCKKNKYGNGEYKTYEKCSNTCLSYVNEQNTGCQRIEGVPWNSYSNLKSCINNSN